MIIIYLIAIFCLSLFIALLLIVITFIFSEKEKRKKRLIFYGFAPLVGFYTLFFVGLFGAFIVSEIKNIDAGVGDCWYVQINGTSKLTFIDLEENAYLEYEGQYIISDVSFINQAENQIVGKTSKMNISILILKIKNLRLIKLKTNYLNVFGYLN